MKKLREVHLWQKIMLGFLSMILIGTIGLATDLFVIVSHAESAAKVTAKSANIRKSADPSSEVLAGVKKDDTVSIKAQTKGSDGETWYQVFVDAQQLGFIRANLVSITDGSTPPSTTATTTTTTASTTTTSTNTSTIQNVSTAPKAVVTEVNPVSTTVTKDGVRVRSDASTNSTIIAQDIAKGFAVTVTGRAEDSDGKTWWRVNFTRNGTEVTGFIRSDYVADITTTDVGSEEPASAQEPEPVAEPEPAEEVAWEIQKDSDGWWLIDCFGQYSEDHLTPSRYNIDNMFKTVEDNRQAYNDASKSAKNLKVVLVILALVIIGLAAVITLLFFKLKELDDSAYFAEAERETARRRSADRPQGSGQRPMQGQRPAQGQGQRPMQGQGQRPVQGQGQRPVQGQGQRPVQGQGQRPVQGQGQRPVQGQGQRPVQGQGQRPVQGQGQRPVQGQGQRPVQGQGQRPVQGQGQRPRPAQNPSEMRESQGTARPQERGTQAENQGGTQKAGWKSKNFMNDEDEFEFLNWDSDEK